MKTFIEWVKDNNLVLNELSPELVGRAADVADARYNSNPSDRISGIRAGNVKPLSGEMGKSFRGYIPPYEKQRFSIVLNTGSNIQEVPVTRIRPNPETQTSGRVDTFTVETDGFGKLTVDLVRRSISTPVGYTFSIERLSAKKLIDQINAVAQAAGLKEKWDVGRLPLFRMAPQQTGSQSSQPDMNVQGMPTGSVPSNANV
jgi:hypothetical protein